VPVFTAPQTGMGREAHEDPAQRWTATAAAGVICIAVGLLGGVAFWGVGAALWGVVAGVPALAVAGWRRR
jgi:benzoate membrane transport protein